MGVQKELEEQLVFVLAMGVGRGAKSQDVTKVLKAGQPTVRPMVEGGDASNWDALKVLREGPTSALPMEVGDAVAIEEGAIKQHEESQDFASGMGEERDAKLKVASVVLKGRLVCVSLMVVGAAANSKVVIKVPKVALHSAKHMGVESDAYLLGALKELREAHLCAKDMVVVNAASLMGEGFAQKVSTEAQTFVSHMAVERGVLFRAVPRVHVAALIAVCATEEGSVASPKTVERVLKVAPISARPTVVERGASGEGGNVRSLLGGRVGYVQHTVVWFRDRRQAKEV